MFKDRAHWADKAFWWVAPIVIVVSAAGGIYYYYHSKNQPPAEVKVKPQTPAPIAKNDETAVKHPIPAAPDDANYATLPELNDSDASVRGALEGLFGKKPVEQMLVPETIIRHIVVTVDNLPRQKVAVEKRPVKALAGQTVVVTEGDRVTLSEANYARYAPVIALVKNMDAQQVSDLYFRFYPLFQQAYEDLGYPGQYFNDRLVEAIDSLLAAPEVTGPVDLVQPRVFYEYADPKLEARPAGQKLMVRMGRENAAQVKEKLRALRKAITDGGPKPEPSGISSPPGGLRHWL